MATSRGKEFETFVKRDLEKVEGVVIIRLYDPVGGYVNVKNLCDFILYRKPNMFCLECKSIKGNTLSYDNISQYDDLVKHSGYDGVESGVLIWYIEHKEVYWVNAEYMRTQREKLNKKSINIKDLRVACLLKGDVIKIDCEIKRINPVCDFTSFFNKFN